MLVHVVEDFPKRVCEKPGGRKSKGLGSVGPGRSCSGNSGLQEQRSCRMVFGGAQRNVSVPGTVSGPQTARRRAGVVDRLFFRSTEGTGKRCFTRHGPGCRRICQKERRENHRGLSDMSEKFQGSSGIKFHGFSSTVRRGRFCPILPAVPEQGNLPIQYPVTNG
jgi:hypothetical protein